MQIFIACLVQRVCLQCSCAQLYALIVATPSQLALCQPDGVHVRNHNSSSPYWHNLLDLAMMKISKASQLQGLINQEALAQQMSQVKLMAADDASSGSW
jgi:predicted transcriptional regulator